MPPSRVEFLDLKKANMPLPMAAAHLAALHQGRGARVLILARDMAQAGDLDQALWTFDQNSFVPHAIAGAPDQENEPVLISLSLDNLNQAQVLILTHPLSEPPTAAFPHIIQLVPGQPGPDLDACRSLYRRLKDQGKVELIHSTRVG